ncbi:MAG: hypothetical protein IH823_04000, partial [Candidatus Dadabacteria bacterium]|nr:hypothetical protein [Candidatus Dadabacteria bacterium]
MKPSKKDSSKGLGMFFSIALHVGIVVLILYWGFSGTSQYSNTPGPIQVSLSGLETGGAGGANQPPQVKKGTVKPKPPKLEEVKEEVKPPPPQKKEPEKKEEVKEEEKPKEKEKPEEKIVKKEKKKIVLAKDLVSSSVKEVEKFYDEAIKLGNEGLMFKALDAPYKPGSRVGHMVKLKPVMDTLDLVIVGAEWGEGKRSGWLTSFIVACVDDEGTILEVGKVGTGIK